MAVVTGETLPGLLRRRAAENPAGTALREKEFGVWRKVSWGEYLARVRDFALGLSALGLSPGDKVAILSGNRREWLYAELAAMSASAVGVGVYPTSPAPEVGYVVGHSESSYVVVEDQEQADKILEAIDGLPLLRRIVVIDMKGMRRYDDPRLVSYAEVERIGAERGREAPALFDGMVSAVDPGLPAFLIYTSGTTGFPKGATISHRNIMAQADSVIEATGIRASDSVVSYLPLCHVAEQIFSAFLPLSLGMTVNFAESVRTIQEDLREIAPTVFLGVPRIWEKLKDSIVIGIQETDRARRWLSARAIARGTAIAKRRLEGRGLRASDRAVRLLCDLFVFRALRNFVGLRRARLTFTAAAAISPEVILFFHAIGIPVREGYGMTECTGFSFLQREGDIRPGTVGRPIPGVSFRIAEDGELLKKGDGVFLGYYRDPAATAEAVRDGWLHTGDVAEADPDGHLRIVDRKKAIIVTAGGKNVSPSMIENALKVSPYVKEAVVIGEGERFLAALVQIDYENTGQWATERRLAYTNFRSLAQLPEVRDLIAREVERVNGSLASAESIRKFRLLEKELDHDDNEMTATMKVRRQSIYEKFAPVIREIYG